MLHQIRKHDSSVNYLYIEVNNTGMANYIFKTLPCFGERHSQSQICYYFVTNKYINFLSQWIMYVNLFTKNNEFYQMQSMLSQLWQKFYGSAFMKYYSTYISMNNCRNVI